MYTKIMLTVIALLLAAIALTPFVQPQPAMAQGNFSGVQMVVLRDSPGSELYFFDTRTGDIWEYSVWGTGTVKSHHKLTQLGKDME